MADCGARAAERDADDRFPGKVVQVEVGGSGESYKMHMKYSYLACGPRVKCGLCGKIEWSQVKQSSDEGLNWVPYSLRRTKPIPVSWSLHCGGSCSQKPWTTTVFETLENPLFRNLTEKNRERYECNRKKVVGWLLAGWPETEERIRTNSLIYVSKGSIKEFVQLVLDVVGQDPHLLGSYDTPTTDALKEAHKRHLAYLKRQFPELLHVRDTAV
jgi:hypothetical protein